MTSPSTAGQPSGDVALFFASTERNKSVDILRALAVLLVLGRHLIPCPPETSVVASYFSRLWIQGGWVGVDLFFVLSGFLVSGLLFREYQERQELRVWRFLVRRGFKIYPPFWLLIAVTVAEILSRPQQIPLPVIASELLFLQNYFLSIWNHTWSLAIEEHFYILLALSFHVMAKWRPRQPFAILPTVFVVVALACLLLRMVNAQFFAYQHQTHLFPTHLRLDSLSFGVAVAYFYHFHYDKFVSWARRFSVHLGCLGIFLVLPAFVFVLEQTVFMYTFGLTLLYLGGGCILAAVLGSEPPSNRCADLVAYIGKHSYSVYLWHMAVATWGVNLFNRFVFPIDSWFVYATIYLAGSLIFGIGMSLIIEGPTLRLRNSLYPSGTTGVLSTKAGSSPASGP